MNKNETFKDNSSDFYLTPGIKNYGDRRSKPKERFHSKNKKSPAKSY